MGTSWVVDTRQIDGIPFDELVKCKLAVKSKDNTKTDQLLRKGKSHVWAYRMGDGMTNFETYGGNDPYAVFTELSEIFGHGEDITFLSEHDDDYRYIGPGPDFNTTHHRHGVDFEVSLYLDDTDPKNLKLQAEWRIDGELVESEELNKLERSVIKNGNKPSK